MNATVVQTVPTRFGVRATRSDSSRPGRYKGHGEDYVARFHKLVRQWRSDTAHLSGAGEIFSHVAFREIVAMGDKAIPLVVSEIETQPDLLVAALPAITGDDPVASGDRGNVYAMVVAWIDWYRRRYP